MLALFIPWMAASAPSQMVATSEIKQAVDDAVAKALAQVEKRVEKLVEQRLAALDCPCVAADRTAPASLAAPLVRGRALGVADAPASGDSASLEMSPSADKGAFFKAFDTSLHVGVGSSTATPVFELNTNGVQVEGSVDATGTFNFYTSGGVQQSQVFASADGLTLHPFWWPHLHNRHRWLAHGAHAHPKLWQSGHRHLKSERAASGAWRRGVHCE